MNRQLGFLIAALLLVPTLRADADLIVSVGPATVPAGGTGTLAVFIRSTGPTVNLDSFGFDFQVRGTGPYQLYFSQAQPYACLDPRYVLYNHSSDAAGSPPSQGAVSGPGDQYAHYLGGDITPNAGEYVAVGTQPLLLTILQFTAATQQPPPAGATFAVSLVADPNMTYFSNAGSNIAYTSTAGTVTVAAATPEPSSCILLVLGGLIAIAPRARARLGRRAGPRAAA